MVIFLFGSDKKEVKMKHLYLIKEQDNLVVNNDEVMKKECFELEDEEKIEDYDDPRFSLDEVCFVRFINYTINLTEDELKDCAFYNKNYAGKAYQRAESAESAIKIRRAK